MTVTCVNDPPVADTDAFDFIGNTLLRVDQSADSNPEVRLITGGTQVFSTTTTIRLRATR